ncbi:MAG TPA: FecR family protein [bacterium]
MRIKKYLLNIQAVVIFLLVALIVAYSLAQQPKVDKKGLVTYTDGRVKKKVITEEDWTTAEKNTEVLTGDRVRTYQKSRAELELLDVDVIRIAPETIIDIVKLYEETKTKVKETQIAVEKGDVWANIKKKEDNVKFGISAPVAVAAITGTILRMGVLPDSSTLLKVYKGEVKITNAPERTDLVPKTIQVHEVPGPHEIQGPYQVSMDEWIYIVRNMQKIVINNKGQIKEVGDFKKSDKDETTDWVRWNSQRDKLR